MNFFAVFLRGVNVGGVKVLMKDLATLLQEAGFAPVKTLLASGNVVVGTDESDPSRVKERIEQALRGHYGREIGVIVQDGDQLESLTRNYPFDSPDDGVARHRYLVLTPNARDAGEVLGSAPAPTDSERVAQLGSCICWEVPRGDSLGTALAKHFAKVASSKLVTTRNMNTVEKVLVALRTLAR
ncbi:pyridoxamine 5-phosphate oxidase [Arthrobacter sp. AQ5-05]|uniref:DUF1697 domain-containing protein n=1 Tax=Arthrobacter sp. AQ5-05 TaxID=2184581 RepID=UPI000DCF4D7A|nr:DUF1697 domain-containing protein [Arthrobacter sp. AQ5-05]RAX49369.1 pyridoxamine 5-phosphate oxidase [Arthrobacter sp. AQ5-05]